MGTPAPDDRGLGRIRTLTAIVGIVAGMGAPGSASAQAQSSPTPAEFFGLNAQGIGLAPHPRDDPAALARNAEAIAGLGVRLVRVNFDWREHEPVPPLGELHAYSWQGSDRLVAQAARSGLRIYADLAGTPFWATTPARLLDCVAGFAHPGPTNVDAYARYAGALAERYGPAGTFWAANPGLPYLPVLQIEIWNEPNWSFWCPAPEPEALAELALRAANAIHAVDPQVEAVLGGLVIVRDVDAPSFAMALDEFANRAFAARPELAGALDAVGVHSYAADADGVIAKLAWAREVLDRAGAADLPLDLNEFGWATQGGEGTLAEPQRATAVADVASRLWRSDCSLRRVFLHTWRSSELSAADSEHWYGVANPSTAEPYPTALAYGAQIAVSAADADPDPVCNGPPALRIKRVRTRGRRARVRFSADERADFECRLDRRPRRACSSPVRYRHLRRGRHRIRVIARDDEGGSARAKRRFRIRPRPAVSPAPAPRSARPAGPGS